MKIATVSILLLLPLSNVRSDEPVEIPICRRTDDGTGTPTFEPLVVIETLPDDIEMFDFATNHPVALTPPLLEDLCGGNYYYNFGESSRCAGYCCASAWNSPYYVVPECDGKQDPGECEVVLVDNHYPNVGYGQYCSVGLGYWVHHSEGCWTGNDNTDTVKVGPNTTFQWCIHDHGSGCQPKVTGPTTVDVSGRGLTEVFVFDETPPTITCPADGDVAVTEDCSLPPDFKATVTDNCYDGAWEESPTTSGPVPSLGSHVIEFSTSDRSGNPASCSTTVTLVDQMPPTITCPANPFWLPTETAKQLFPPISRQQ
jgi:hypothetical protein